MKIKNALLYVVCWGGLALFGANTFAQQVTVIPASPVGRETVRLLVSALEPYALGRESVSMVNNRLTVTLRTVDNSINPGPQGPSDDVAVSSSEIVLGQFPQGSYVADVQLFNRQTTNVTTIGSATFSVTNETIGRDSNYPAYNFTDLWWNPAESGWGISIHVKRSILFAAWFAYDSTGAPTWYTIQGGRWISPNIFSGGRIYKAKSNPNAGPGPLTQLSIFEAGTATIVFNAYDQATMTFVVDGLGGSKNIVRQVF